MTKFVSSFGDKMLARVLKKDDAGACIVDGWGSFCGWVPVSGGKCGADGHWYQEVCYGVQGCYGNCIAECYRGISYQHTGAVC